VVLLYKADGAYGQYGAGRVNKHLQNFTFIIMYVICICLVPFMDTGGFFFFFKFLVYGLEHFHSIFQKQELAKRGLSNLCYSAHNSTPPPKSHSLELLSQ